MRYRNRVRTASAAVLVSLLVAPFLSSATSVAADTPAFPAPDCPPTFGPNHAKLLPSLLSDATHTVKRYAAGGDKRGGEVGCEYYDDVRNYNYGWTVYYLFATDTPTEVARAVADGYGPLGGWDHPSPLGCGVSQTLYAFVDCSPSNDAPTKAAALEMLATLGTVAASRAKPGPTAAPTTTSPPAKLALCPEAVSFFPPAKLQAAGINDVSSTSIHIDGKDLLDSFQQTIATFNTNHSDGHAYVTNNTPGGTLGAIAFLFSNGGPVAALDRLYTTGNEPALNKQMIELAKARHAVGGAPLSPADVFGLALDLESGNVTRALLTAHNTLRALARGDGAGVGVSGPAVTWIQQNLAPIRDGDLGGPWYHLFGTAYLETVARGDMAQRAVAAFGDASAYLDGVGGDPFAAAADQYPRQLPAASSLSDLANAVEQAYRENVADENGHLNKPDPEKYCFNVWGAQLGAQLYKTLPLYSTSKIEGLFSSFTANTDRVPDVPDEPDGPPLIECMASPFSVQWSNGARATVLDQGASPEQANLFGDLPIFLVPVLEADSWGAVWLSSGAAGATVTFEAMRDGAELHYARTDVASGRTAYYLVTAAHAGDRYTVTPATDRVEAVMLGPDGQRVTPQIVGATAPAAEQVGAPRLDAPRKSGGVPTLAIVAAAAVTILLGAGIFVSLRRRRVS